MRTYLIVNILCCAELSGIFVQFKKKKKDIFRNCKLVNNLLSYCYVLIVKLLVFINAHIAYSVNLS